MNEAFDFFITGMPDSRPADYYIGCLEGSVFIDFNHHDNNRICLIRISFDGYGCCSLTDEAIAMNEADSRDFKELVNTQLANQIQFTDIIKRTILNNRKLIWEDALREYDLL